MTRKLRKRLADGRVVRQIAAAVFLGRAAFYWLCRAKYRAICDVCSSARAAHPGSLQRLAHSLIFRLVGRAQNGGENPIIESYLRSALSERCAALYAISGRGKHDIYRDLIVLKSADAGEKGVILLKYARTFEAVVALMDFRRLLDRYVFVLEPCWSGYCDPALLMFVSLGHPVVVQCFTEADHRFIARIGWPLVPVRMGPADWVDAEVFQAMSKEPKCYDIVMVANWGVHKRHMQLFRALKQINDRRVRVLLAGYPWAGRTAANIRQDFNAISPGCADVDIVESLPHPELAQYLSRSKVFVFLSKKEGDNKALVEAMFADVPAIVYRDTVGGAGSRINIATGVFSTDDELPATIRYMLDHYTEFSPRAWALKNTGSSIATQVIDDRVANSVRKFGGTYTRHIVEKCNSPNLAYRDPSHRSSMESDYLYIDSCVRSRYRA